MRVAPRAWRSLPLAERHRRVAHLARWLGPWAGDDAPEALRSDVTVRTTAGALRAYLYEPSEAATGAYLVVPGLHPLGPDDPRLDRFCRVLASAGLCVLAPFVRSYLALVVSPRAADDVAAAWRHTVQLARSRALPRPAMLTISFGSMPALQVAARADHQDEVGGLVLFGGYCDFGASIRFCLTGRAFDGDRELYLPHDPLNAPAVFINLLGHIAAPEPRERLQEAWLEMCRRTWGKPELRPHHLRVPIAEQIAAELPRAQRELFHIGCGLAPGGPALLEAALAASEDYFAFANPRSSLARIAAPILIAHGRDDDVIPWVEARKLDRALPTGHRAKLALTRLFGHTGAVLPSPSALRSELANLSELLYGVVDAAHERLLVRS
jgi:pimeloyl-ACP methyl ester carboxylesterase